MEAAAPGTCQVHEAAPALATCARCGGGACAECLIEERGRSYCAPCFREMKLAALEARRPAPASPREAPEAEAPAAETGEPSLVRSVVNLSIGGLAGGFAAFAAAAIGIRFFGLGGASTAEGEQVFYIFAITGLVVGMVVGVALRRTRRVLIFFAVGFGLSLLSFGTMRELAAERRLGADVIDEDWGR